jgi:hypothetical protein
LDTSALDTVITAANAAKVGVEISADGTDVAPGTFWVTQEVNNTLNVAIATATAAKATVTTEQEVTDAVAALDAAVVAYNTAKADGIWTLDTSAIDTVITAANAAKVGVEISADGTDVAPGTFWVTQEVNNTLNVAIATATAAKATVTTEQEVTDAADALDAAVVTFKDSKQEGSEFNLNQVAQDAITHMEENETIAGYEEAYPVADLSYVAGTLTSLYTQAALEGYRDHRNASGGNFDILAGVMNDFARYFKSLNEVDGITIITYGGTDYTWDSGRAGASKYASDGTTLVSVVVSQFVSEVEEAGGDYSGFTFEPFVFTIKGKNLTVVLSSAEWSDILNVFHGEKWPVVWDLHQVAQDAIIHMEENETIAGYEEAYPVADLSYVAGTLTSLYTQAALEGYRDHRNASGGNFDILAGVMNDFARYFKSLNEVDGITIITYGGTDYTWDSGRAGASKYASDGTTLVSVVVSQFVSEVEEAGGDYSGFTFEPFVFTIKGKNLTVVLSSAEWSDILNVFHGEKWPVVWDLDQVAQDAIIHMEENETIAGYEEAYPVADLSYVAGTLTSLYTQAALEGYRDHRNASGGNFDILAGVMNDFARYFKSLNEVDGITIITYGGTDYTWDSGRAGASKYTSDGTTLVSVVVSQFVSEVEEAGGDYSGFTFEPFVFTIKGKNLTVVLSSAEWSDILNVFHGEKWPVSQKYIEIEDAA